VADITLKGNPIKTVGNLPEVGATAPDFTLVKTDLSEASLSSYKGKKVLNIFPSLDTGLCAASVRTFNKKVSEKSGVTVLNISCDLPFAHKRFCAAEGIENAVNLSAFRGDFADKYGVKIATSVMQGLCSRAVVVLDDDNKVLYTEQVPEIGQEPAYDAAFAQL